MDTGPKVIARLMPSGEKRPELENNMPRRPRGERRPADTVGAATIVAKIATGEIEEKLTVKSGRVRSGHAGVKARAQKLSAEERSKIAKKAAGARWERA